MPALFYEASPSMTTAHCPACPCQYAADAYLPQHSLQQAADMEVLEMSRECRKQIEANSSYRVAESEQAEYLSSTYSKLRDS